MPGPEHDPAADLQAQGRGLRQLARAILRGTDGADDIVQEARAIELAAAPAAVDRRGWLARVVQNLARRELRDRARRQRHHESLPAPAAAPAPDDVLAEVETHRLVTDAMLQLGAAYRRVLVLRYWHDLPPRAIARKLDMPVATVKTQLQRALAELRQRLDHRAGDRRAWLAALVPIAHPPLLGLGAPLTLATTATLATMTTKHAALLVLACLCLGVLLWRPWVPPGFTHATVEQVDPARVDIAVAPPERAPIDAVVAGTPDVAATRVPLVDQDPERYTVSVVGRIVGPGDGAVANARIRLVCKFDWPQPPPFDWRLQSPPIAAAAGTDGRFELAVPGRRGLFLYSFALADAPGWAVREVSLVGDVQKKIVDDRLDLGTLRLERGVAVRGRVDEADGSPLRTRARLLAWDPSREGSHAMMNEGRTVGFVEPGGSFELADRLSAGGSGAWMLAAICRSGVGWARLEFAAGQERLAPVTIRLLPGGRVDVRVLDPSGQPIADALVHAVPYFKPIGLTPMWEPRSAYNSTPQFTEPKALFLRRTGPDGGVSFVNLPRRKHPSIRDANTQQRPTPAIIVVARSPGYIVNHATVDPSPPAEGPAAVTITLTRQLSASFAGTVATADGVRLAGVTVRLNGGAVSTVTDTKGRYDLPMQTFGGKQAYFVLEGGDVPLTQELVDIPPAGGPVTHDFVVELRAPVTGRVVDQLGAPVTGVEVLLGEKGGVHYPSTPKRSAADGRFAFPDAIASHTDLWVQPPAPATAWRVEQPRPLSRRDGEIIELRRFEGALADLTIAVTDGRTGAAVSPSKVDLWRLHGNSPDFGTIPHVHFDLALGKATATHLPSGRYRAMVHAADGLAAERDFTLPADATEHTERLELWPATAVVCTVDASALSPGDVAARNGRTFLALLDSWSAKSHAVDAQGKRLNYTPNTGAFQIGGDMEFRLERITPRVPLRLHVAHDGLFGEVWFRAEPGAVARVVLRLVPTGGLALKVPETWPAGTIELDAHVGDAWRPLRFWRHAPGSSANNRHSVPRPTGDVRWRIVFWPKGGGERIERVGRSEVRSGETVEVRLG